MSDIVLELQNVSRIFGEGDAQVKALDNVSLSIRRGEFVLIVGSSGSGKTSIIDLITMLNLPSKGNIKVDGILLNDFQVKNWRNQIGYVSQDPIIFDGRNLYDLESMNSRPFFYQSIGRATVNNKKG